MWALLLLLIAAPAFAQTETPTPTATETQTPTATPTCGARVTVVNTLADHDDGCCTAGDCTLREAVNTSLSGETITFSVTGTISLTLAPTDPDLGAAVALTVTHPLTISHADPTTLIIDASGLPAGDTRVLYMKGQNIQLAVTGITITGTTSATGGGMIDAGDPAGTGDISADTLTLTNVVLQGNVVTSGAIVNFCGGGAFTFNGSTVSGNTGTGGITELCTTTATIIASHFSNNYGSASSALDFQTGTGTASVQTTDFVANAGGPVVVVQDGTVTISAVTWSANTETALSITAANAATAVTVVNSTFANNSSASTTAGLKYLPGGSRQLTLNNDTFSSNFGGASANHLSGGVTAQHNIIFGPGDPGSLLPNCTGGHGIDDYILDYDDTCNDGSAHDLINSDPLLAALASNGGLTQTMAIDTSSPAYNAGDNVTCEATDQRGVARPQATTCDIGAFEFEPPTPTPTVTQTRTITPTITATVRSTRTSTPTPSVTPTATPTGQVPLDDNTHWNTTEYTIEHGSPRITHEQQCLDANFAPRDPLVCRCVTWFQRIAPPGTILWLARCPGDETSTILRVMGPIR